jgi:hypothetical protein
MRDFASFHSALEPTGAFGPVPTFVDGAANGSFEPDPDSPKIRCVRSRKPQFDDAAKIRVALQQEERPFMQAAAKSTTGMTRSRDKTDFVVLCPTFDLKLP